jgi:hypothetical protein
VDSDTGDRDQPQRVVCAACDRPIDALDLLSDWKAKDLDALLMTGPLRCYCPQPQTFIVDQYEPGKFWIGRTIFDALHGRVGPVFPLTRRLSRIEAMDADHALTLAQEHHGAMPWRDVPITPELEPVDVAWHGGPLAPWEQWKALHQRQRAKAQARAELDRDVDAFRAMRAAELKV